MKWTTSNIDILRSPLGVMVVIPAPHDNDLAKLDKEKEYVIEIKKKSKSRSMNANAYCWVLCQKIAEVMSNHSYMSKEDVYRKAIKDCSHFTYVPVREDAGECKSIKGYHNIMCYHGSSVYTVAEMQRLIDCLVDECNQLGIKLDDSDYIQSLVKEWGNEQAKKE